MQGLLHPCFHDEASGSRGASDRLATTSARSFIQELRGYRPKAEKVGNVLSTTAMNIMKQAKLDSAAVAVLRAHGDNKPGTSNEDDDDEDDEGDADHLQRPFKKAKVNIRVRADRARMSKKQRQKMGKENTVPVPGARKAGAEDFSGFDVMVDGVALGASSPAPVEMGKAKPKQQVEQFYLSVEIDQKQDAKERGLDMEQYQMDLMPDDSSDIKRAKSVMRWDAKKKKYLPTMVSVDGRVVKGQRKNESGQKVKGDGEKSGLYKKWAKTTKKRIQKVGELETGASDPLGHLKPLPGGASTVDFGDSGGGGWDGDEGGEDNTASDRKRKPVVPFHGQIEDKYLTNKQKRMTKRRARNDKVVGGPAKKELRTATDIQKEKKLKQKNKLKQAPEKRKEKAKSAKDARSKMHQDRQMKFGARTKSKMMIFEGKRTRNKGTKRGFTNI